MRLTRIQFVLLLQAVLLLAACAPDKNAMSNLAQSSPAALQCVPTPTHAPRGTPTPTPNEIALGTPIPFSTVTPIPFSQVIDLAPDLAAGNKTQIIVYRCDGRYELFLTNPSLEGRTVTETLQLEPGDIVVSTAYPMLPRVHPPEPLPQPTTRIEGITLEQARENAGFHLLEPTYLPKGFHLLYVTQWSVEPGNMIHLEYVGPGQADGSGQAFLILIEESLPSAPVPPMLTPPPPPPPSGEERVQIRGHSALVLKVFSPPAWFTPEHPGQLYPCIAWGENNLELTLGGSVTLEELARIAESLH